MTITGAIVLFASIWFVTLLAVLPLGLRTQGETGRVEPGTPRSAPVNARIRRKMLWVTVITFALWTPLVLLIASGAIGIRDIDIWGRM